jgi:hypothetical protein
MTNWKAVAVFAGVGVFLSLIFGIFAGNPFGVVLLRVVLCGAVAAGMGFGLLYVVDRFLPEVGGGAPQTQAVGEHIDIVVPGENPHDTSEERAEGAPADDADLVADAVVGESEVDEISDTDSIELSPESGGEFLSGGADEEAGEPQEIGAAEESDFGSGAEPAETGSFAGGRVDSLGGRAASVNAGGQEQDPEVVARAVRTMMKRDEEG